MAISQKTRKEKDAIVKDMFEKIIPLIEEGVGIKEAMEMMDIPESSLYLYATEQQKLEIQQLKASFRDYRTMEMPGFYE